MAHDPVPDEHHRHVAAAMAGAEPAALSGHRGQMFQEHGMLPAVYDRIAPAVRADLADSLRPYFEHVAAELVRIGGAGLAQLDPAVHDPCGSGYRIAVHVARFHRSHPENVLRALLQLEVGLTFGALGDHSRALSAARKAASLLEPVVVTDGDE